MNGAGALVGSHRALGSEADESELALSPSVAWLASTSDESGRREVYLRLYPELNAKFKISADAQRFLTLERLPDGATEIVFVPNWISELERLVPSSEASRVGPLLREKPEAFAVRRFYYFEMPAIERDDDIRIESLGGGDHGGIDASQWKIRILLHELSDSCPLLSERSLDVERLEPAKKQ